MKRGEIYWAKLRSPVGRRPVLVVSNDRAIRALREVCVAAITSSSRGTLAELSLGVEDGLNRACVANCFSLQSVPKTLLDRNPVGRLPSERFTELDEALVNALGIDVLELYPD